jgi:hypothetical protein
VRHVPTSKFSACPVCGVTDGRCRTHADSELVLCASVNDRLLVPPGWRFAGLAKNPLWGKLYPDNQRDWPERQRQQWQADRSERRQRIAQQQQAARAALPTLQQRHDLLSAKPHVLTVAQNADLLRRGLTQHEIDGCLSRGWLWQERGGYGIAAIDPVTGLIVGGQIANDSRTPKYSWLLPGQTNLPETGQNPLPVWISPQFDLSNPAQVRVSEGFLQSLIVALVAWRTDPQIITLGAGGAHWGDCALSRVVAGLPAAESFVLYPDSGSTANTNVLGGYKSLHDNLRRLKIRLQVAWWGQWRKKLDRDPDELDGSENIEIHSWKWFQQFLHPEFWHQTHKPAIVLNDRYLPEIELPAGGSILAVDSPMGTGKTHALEGLLAQFWERHPDGIADLVGYRNGLLLQTCDRINRGGRVTITHKHEMSRDSGGWVDAPSLAYCLNSLDSRIDALNTAIDDGRTVLIGLDEVDFIVDHWLEMMRSQPSTGLEFAKLIQRIGQCEGYILALQADLVGLPLNFLRELAPNFPLQLIKNNWRGDSHEH